MTLATSQVVDDYYSFILHFIAQIKVWIHNELMVHSVFFYFFKMLPTLLYMKPNTVNVALGLHKKQKTKLQKLSICSQP